MKKVFSGWPLFRKYQKQMYIDPLNTGNPSDTDYKDVQEMRRITGIEREIVLMNGNERILNWGNPKKGMTKVGASRHGKIFLRKDVPRAENFWILLHEECHYIYKKRTKEQKDYWRNQWAAGNLKHVSDYGQRSFEEYFAERCAGIWMDRIENMPRRDYVKEGILPKTNLCEVRDGKIIMTPCCDYFRTKYSLIDPIEGKRKMLGRMRFAWFDNKINSSWPVLKDGDTLFLGSKTKSILNFKEERCNRLSK